MRNYNTYISYKGKNGYSGKLYSKASLSIYDQEGKEVLHTYSRGIETWGELKQIVDSFPDFLKRLEEYKND